MGQYKQWLHYREIDRQLHVQLRRLEDEFVQLQIQLDAQPAAETAEQLSSNAIVQALARFFGEPLEPLQNQDEQQPDSSLQQQTPDSFPTSPTSSDLTLLPEDMAAFMQPYAPQAPAHTPPWWADTFPLMPSVEPASGPVDGQSVRTNKLVQRWFERWGRQPGASQEAAEDFQ
jgi:hypothetical protein